MTQRELQSLSERLDQVEDTLKAILARLDTIAKEIEAQKPDVQTIRDAKTFARVARVVAITVAGIVAAWAWLAGNFPFPR